LQNGKLSLRERGRAITDRQTDRQTDRIDMQTCLQTGISSLVILSVY
jgi:hypothetical protein